MAKLAEDLASKLEGDATLPLVTLESGAVIGIDRAARWMITSAEGERIVFEASTAHAFAEAIERPRDGFDDELMKSAAAAGLDANDALAAFPALEIVRAVLAKQFAYLTRLALLWIRPSELRELRPVIVAVAETPNTPGPVRDLARRLIVPDTYD